MVAWRKRGFVEQRTPGLYFTRNSVRNGFNENGKISNNLFIKIYPFWNYLHVFTFTLMLSIDLFSQWQLPKYVYIYQHDIFSFLFLTCKVARVSKLMTWGTTSHSQRNPTPSIIPRMYRNPQLPPTSKKTLNVIFAGGKPLLYRRTLGDGGEGVEGPEINDVGVGMFKFF